MDGRISSGSEKMKKTLILVLFLAFPISASANPNPLKVIKDVLTRILAKQLDQAIMQTNRLKDQYDISKVTNRVLEDKLGSIENELSGNFDLSRINDYEANKTHNRWLPESWNEAIRDSDIGSYTADNFSLENLKKKYAAMEKTSDDAMVFNRNLSRQQDDYQRNLKHKSTNSKESTDAISEGILLVQDQNQENIRLQSAMLKMEINGVSREAVLG